LLWQRLQLVLCHINNFYGKVSSVDGQLLMSNIIDTVQFWGELWDIIGVSGFFETRCRTRSYMNAGERYFLRKLRNSYGSLTDERNSYVGLLLQRGTEIRLRINGNVTLETRCNIAVFRVRINNDQTDNRSTKLKFDGTAKKSTVRL